MKDKLKDLTVGLVFLSIAVCLIAINLATIEDKVERLERKHKSEEAHKFYKPLTPEEWEAKAVEAREELAKSVADYLKKSDTEKEGK
jgi:uncharacterized protein YpmS